MRVVPRRTQALIVAALVLAVLVLLLLAWRLGLVFGPPETVLSPGATPAATVGRARRGAARPRRGGARPGKQKEATMPDTSVTKIDSRFSPKGEMGQKYLAAGIDLSMRLWEDEPPGEPKPPTRRDYEAVGYVIKGRAELHLEGQVVRLEPGNSWVVPKGASHSYRILEPFTAVEATSPPAQVHGRDAADEERRRPGATAAAGPETASGGPPGDVRDLGDAPPGDVRAAAGDAVVPGPNPA